MQNYFTMKNIVGSIFTLTLFSCQTNNLEEPILSNESSDDLTEKKSSVLIGSWQVDSSVFVDNGVEGIFEPPIAPTTWTFAENGDYFVENTMRMSGTFLHDNNQIDVELMGIKTDYQIIELNKKHLITSSTIYENDNGSLITKAYLTKIADE